jgi:hypothetical protein
MISIVGGTFSPSSIHSPFLQDVVEVLTWFLFSTNSLFAAVVSEAILIDDQSLFYTTNSFLGSSSMPLLSPWIIYVAFHVFLTVLLILLSIYFVGRTER